MPTKAVVINDLAYTMTYTLGSNAAPTVTALTLDSDGSDHLNQLKNSDQFLAYVEDISKDNRTPGVDPRGLGTQKR